MSASTFQSTTVAKYLEGIINTGAKSQIDIAADCGWPKPNMVCMVKQGVTRLPLDKVGPLAKSLDIDPIYLLRLTMQEYVPETFAAIEAAIGTTILTEKERRLVEKYRTFTADTDADVVMTDSKDIIALVMV
ncbi:MAG: hypothetical protein IH606_05385 [Burkholderiales bacterium]|nr:hypothetical protein [Burkholderiales bacterium]